MNRNTLYFLVGGLVVAVLVIGYLLYRERQSGIEIKIGEQGISVDGK